MRSLARAMRMEMLGNWSWPIGRLFAIEIRLHWTLLLIVLLGLSRHFQHGWAWYWIPILIAIPLVSILLHEFGHSLTARAVGGESRQIVMWAFGGLAMCEVPPTPLKRFLVTFMGPVVTLILAVIPSALVGAVPPPIGGDGFAVQAVERFGAAAPLLYSLALLNAWLLLFNLLPCYPLDGGSMLRSILWPIVGLAKAMVITIYCAYVCLGGLLLWSFHDRNVMLALLAMMLFFSVVQEHRAIRAGYDPYHGTALGTATDHSREATWFDRQRARRAAKRRAQVAAEHARIESELDRLLEKVSTQGLPSLSAKERRFLNEYSRNHRD